MNATATTTLRHALIESDGRCFKEKRKHGTSHPKFRHAVIERDKARAMYSEYRESERYGETIS